MIAAETAGMPPEEAEAAAGMMRGMMPAIIFTFGADQSLSVTFGEEVKVGTYSVAGNQVTLTPPAEEAAAGETPETLTWTLEGDRLTLRGEGEGADTMVFVRQP